MPDELIKQYCSDCDCEFESNVLSSYCCQCERVRERPDELRAENARLRSLMESPPQSLPDFEQFLDTHRRGVTLESARTVFCVILTGMRKTQADNDYLQSRVTVLEGLLRDAREDTERLNSRTISIGGTRFVDVDLRAAINAALKTEETT